MLNDRGMFFLNSHSHVVKMIINTKYKFVRTDVFGDLSGTNWGNTK